MAKRKFISKHKKSFLSLAATGGKYALDRVMTRSQTKKKQRAIQPRPVTSEHDYKVDYRKKFMPRRKRRRWTSFKRKVDYIADKRLGLKSWLVTSAETFTAAASTSNFFSEELYSIDGTTNHKDIGDIARSIIGPTIFDNMNTTTTSNTIETSKLITFESANIEVTLRNVSTTEPLILEVYHFKCRKDGLQFGTGSYNYPGGYYQQGFNKLPLPVDPDTGESPDTALSDPLTAFTPGTTPFQSPFFCQHFQILKREKFTVPALGTIQKSLRIPMNRTINTATLRSRNMRRNLTEGWLFQFQGNPGLVESNPVSAVASQVVVSTVKRYAYYLRGGGFDAGVIRNP